MRDRGTEECDTGVVDGLLKRAKEEELTAVWEAELRKDIRPERGREFGRGEVIVGSVMDE